jgi:hypothetical protein
MSEKKRRGRVAGAPNAGRGGLMIRRARLTIPNGFRRRLCKAGFVIVRRRVAWFWRSPEVWMIVPKAKRAQRATDRAS